MCSTQQYLVAVSGCVWRQVVACVLVNELVLKMQHQCGVRVNRAVKGDGKLAILLHVVVMDQDPCMCKEISIQNEKL